MLPTDWDALVMTLEHRSRTLAAVLREIAWSMLLERFSVTEIRDALLVAGYSRRTADRVRQELMRIQEVSDARV